MASGWTNTVFYRHRPSFAQEEILRAQGRESMTMRFGLVPPGLLSDASITPFAIRVYAAISWFKGTREDRRPTLSALASFLHASTDGVYQAVKALKRSGWCSVTKSSRESAYRLHASPERNLPS